MPSPFDGDEELKVGVPLKSSSIRTALAKPVETPRLLLRAFEELDISEQYLRWLNDADVVRFSELRHSHHDAESSRAYLRSIRQDGNLFHAVIEKASQTHIGNVSGYIDYENQVVDLAILIGEKQIWGQGYGAEVWQAIIRHLFENAAIRKISAGAMASNAAMRMLMERSGMSVEGVRIGELLLDGKPEDVIEAGILSPGSAPQDHE